jgi:hypothetical protein
LVAPAWRSASNSLMTWWPRRSITRQRLVTERGRPVWAFSPATLSNACAASVTISRAWGFDNRPLSSTPTGPCRAYSNPVVITGQWRTFPRPACASDRAMTRPYRSGLDTCRSLCRRHSGHSPRASARLGPADLILDTRHSGGGVRVVQPAVLACPACPACWMSARPRTALRRLPESVRLIWYAASGPCWTGSTWQTRSCVSPPRFLEVGRQAETWLRVHYIELSDGVGHAVSSRFAFNRA